MSEPARALPTGLPLSRIAATDNFDFDLQTFDNNPLPDDGRGLLNISATTSELATTNELAIAALLPALSVDDEDIAITYELATTNEVAIAAVAAPSNVLEYVDLCNDLRSLRMKLYKFCLEDLFMKAIADEEEFFEDEEDLSDDDEDDYGSEYDRCEANLQDAGFLPPEDEFDSWSSMEV